MKTLKKTIEKDIRKWKALPRSCAWKPSTDSMQSPSKSQWHSSHKWTEIQKFILKYKWSKIAKTILKINSNTEGIAIRDLKLYYRVTVIKTAWYWQKQKCRSMEQNKEPRNNPTQLWLSDSWQRYKTKQNKTKQNYVWQKTDSPTNGFGQTRAPHVEDWNEIPISHPAQKPAQNRSKALM
jgi:hypothetical protein